MPWTPDRIKHAVAELQPPDDRTEYRVEGETLVGTWSFDSAWAGPTGGGADARSYRVEVDLSDDHTFRLRESEESSETSGGIDPSGAGSLRSERSHFSGRMRKRSFEFGVAPVVSSSDGEGSSSASSFDSEAVKRPLVDLLQRAGWTRHSGFLGRLFGD